MSVVLIFLIYFSDLTFHLGKFLFRVSILKNNYWKFALNFILYFFINPTKFVILLTALLVIKCNQIIPKV